MDADAWRRIEDLYYAAARLPPGERRQFIDDACGEDLLLRSEVEGLLACAAAADDPFLDIPAMDVAGRLMAADWADEQARRIGTTVAKFRIVAPLGVGGMGVVYEAEDLRLGRKVALKFLPARLAANAEAVGRFEVEARAASALNHPNICTIYGVHDHDGQPFIEMERLEGETLRERLARGPVNTSTMMTLARQILDGLDAAHVKGIVHCDLTPGNVFCTERGTKILDFGISQFSCAPEADGSARRGTAAYMSPEHAQRMSLDARTDLFSLGALLYEMATGQAAFQGSSSIPPRILNPALPAALERVIVKALQSARESRYQSASDMRADLEAAERVATRRRWALAGAVAAVLAVALGGATFPFWWPEGDDLFDDANLRLRQITHTLSEHGVRSDAISPDGRRVAYSDPRGIHILDIESGQSRTVPESVPQRGAATWDVTPGWFPDGSGFVATLVPAAGAAGSSIWVVGANDQPRRIRESAQAVLVSPDGHVVFRREGTERQGVRLMDRTGAGERRLFDDDDVAIVGLAWSPDRRRVAYVRADVRGQARSIESRSVDGGTAVPLFRAAEPDVINGMAWLRGGQLIYSIRSSAAGTSGGTMPCTYWQVRVDPRTGAAAGAATRFARWLPECVGPVSLSADGRRMLYRQDAIQDAIHIAALSSGAELEARRLTFTQGRNIPSGWTHDSRSLVYLSDGGGSVVLTRRSITGDAQHLVTADPGLIGAARLTPDGGSVLYRARALPHAVGAGGRVLRVPLEGGTSQEVVTGHFIDGGARCAIAPATLCAVAELAADGRQIVFTEVRAPDGRGRELARRDLDKNADYRWALAPDGTRIALLDIRVPTIHILSLTGLPSSRIDVAGAGTLGYVSWATDSAGLILPTIDARAATLISIDLRGRQRVLWRQPGALDISGIPSPDGRLLAVWVRSRTGNLWLAERR